MGETEIPAYHAVAQLVTLAMQLSLMIVTSSTPFVSRAHAAGDHDQTIAILMRNVRFGVGLMVIIAVTLVLQGDRLIELWLGPGNFVGRGVVAAFAVMPGFLACAGLLRHVLPMSDKGAIRHLSRRPDCARTLR